ncbi:voltage-gated potassium channel [Aureobasidium pullulans]|uniref:Voltage-gated potassium channel n=1 Tax=Aureobasidium pullulans TaxID=5580 RepID=A0A4S8SZS2_AURPU|nr:voltage-gated potassium channel [Aureobasidium pullulans]
MSDAIDEPIKQVAQDIEPEFSEKEKKHSKRRDSGDLGEERDYTNPNRYWFESTACPLIAGTFGPMASAFSICALSSSWRVYIPPGGTVNNGTTIDDPQWLLAINAISLALALIANGSLLLNMAHHLRFSIAQPITIVGFTVSSGLLIADLIALSVSSTYQLPADSPAASAAHHALTSAFYYAIMAAAIYLIIASLMCLTVWGAYKGHYARHFNLTAAQRTLMLQTMSFFTYLLLGALVFSHVEKWEYLDAVYWADVTLLTVGLGDYSPSTHMGRSLFIPFAIGGIVILGLVVGSIRTLVLERGQKKISARMMEKKRLRAVNSVGDGRQRIRVSRFQTMKFVESYTDAAQKREQEFRAMRRVQYCAERDRKWIALAVSTTAAFTLWLVGAAIFHVAEKAQGWTYFQTMYFTYTCLLTIGYGDFTPLSNSSKAFFILWSLLAVPTLTILISDMGDTVVQLFSNMTVWIGSLTVLPDEQGIRTAFKAALKSLPMGHLGSHDLSTLNPGGVTQTRGPKAGSTDNDTDHETTMMDRIADRMAKHLEAEELQEALQAEQAGDTLERDIHFYHFILARETQRMMKDLNSSPPKRYEWGEWEYFLKLMSSTTTTTTSTNEPSANPDSDSDDVIPEELRLPETREQWNRKHVEYRWSWLSRESPLMGHKSETEWILERLGTCLERELRESRLLPYRTREERRKPPVSMAEMVRRGRNKQRGDDRAEEDGKV